MPVTAGIILLNFIENTLPTCNFLIARDGVLAVTADMTSCVACFTRTKTKQVKRGQKQSIHGLSKGCESHFCSARINTSPG